MLFFVLLFSIAGTSWLVKLSASTIYSKVIRNEIPAFKTGKRLYFCGGSYSHNYSGQLFCKIGIYPIFTFWLIRMGRYGQLIPAALNQIVEVVRMERYTLGENPMPDGQIKKADLLSDPGSRLDSREMKERPMGDADIPFRDLTDAASKKESIGRLISKLDVAASIRYQRTEEDTYCNVYSYDYCYFCRVYLPTVWWTDEVLERLLLGQEEEAVFGQTVDRIYSSALHDWFLQWGAGFGWERIWTADEIQNKVNANGGVGIICAKRKERGRSGHIVPVVPETDLNRAYRKGGTVLYPLQSQAGKLNYNFFSEERKDWWNDAIYSSYVMYYHR